MLESAQLQPLKTIVYSVRAIEPNLHSRLQQDGLNGSTASEIIRRWSALGVPYFESDVIDGAFVPKSGYPTPFNPGRFTDGTFGVFYGARHPDTSAAELGYHTHLRSPLDPGEVRTLMVWAVSADCSVIDLHQLSDD